MRARLQSLEQLMPFATAGELIAHKRQPLVSVPPSATARAALREMEEKDIAFLLVLEGEKLVGVVSERDIARGVILQHRTSVREIMTRWIRYRGWTRHASIRGRLRRSARRVRRLQGW